MKIMAGNRQRQKIKKLWLEQKIMAGNYG